MQAYTKSNSTSNKQALPFFFFIFEEVTFGTWTSNSHKLSQYFTTWAKPQGQRTSPPN